MRGRFLIQNWMASVHPQGVVIHYIDHENTELRPVKEGNLVALIPSACGATIAPANLALLDDGDARQWLYGHGDLFEKYGPRKQCKGCVP